MRIKRLKLEDEAHYHLMSHLVEGLTVFDEDDKNMLKRLILRVGEFSGIHVLTYSILDNHFHILVKAPPLYEKVDEETLLYRYSCLYGNKKTKILKAYWESLKEANETETLKNDQEALRARMHDISKYIKFVKQVFTTYYNKKHHRRGVLWESRFKSVLVEDFKVALTTIGGYIDLNPMRAGLEEDPRKYNWNGIHDAINGNNRLRDGIMYITKEISWTAAYRSYITSVANIGMEKREGKATLKEEVYKKLIMKKSVDIVELCCFSIKAFAKGLVLGSKKYVNGFKNENPEYFGQKRKSSARLISSINGEGLYCARGIRKNSFSFTNSRV